MDEPIAIEDKDLDMSNSSQPRSDMDEFFNVVRHFRATFLLAVGGSALFPVISAVARIGPPWPEGVTLFTSLVTLLILVFVFQFLWRKTRKAVNRVMIAGLLLFVLGSVAYFPLYDTFVYTVPTTKERVVVGCGWSHNAETLAAKFLADPRDGCPGNYVHLLTSAEYEVNEIWRSDGLRNAKLALLVAWLTLSVGLMLSVAAFVTFRVRQRS